MPEARTVTIEGVQLLFPNFSSHASLECNDHFDLYS